MSVRALRLLAAAALATGAGLLAGCAQTTIHESAGTAAGTSAAPAATVAEPAPAAPATPDKDGPPMLSEIPPNLMEVPDALPTAEPRTPTGNPDSYSVYGEKYKVLSDSRGYRQRGYASWYGRKFQGKRTSSGEAYDMFKMTAAHKTLPIPCYVRVTNLSNGRSVIVRVNDRGPFHEDRIIDLSYTAALKLAILGGGSTQVEVQSLEPARLPAPEMLAVAAKPRPRPAPAAAPAAAPAVPIAPAAPIVAPVISAPAAPPMVASVASIPLPGPGSAVGQAAPTGAAAPAAAGGTEARFLQAGLFSDPINAVTMREQLNGMGIANVLLKSETRGEAFVHRVLIGPFTDTHALDIARKRLSDVQMPAVPVLN
jgi:rare lipoprotein A